MKIFFDTEFTGLHKNTTLISIGMIAEDGKTFYAEFTDYNEKQCNDWILNNVINNLKYNDKEDWCCNYDNDHLEVVGAKAYIRLQLKQWLLSNYDYIELVSDCCHYDMVLFIDIFGGAFDIPSQICPACHDINQDIARYYNFSEIEAFDYSREKILENRYISIDGSKHNSLYDAKVIKAIYESICQL